MNPAIGTLLAIASVLTALAAALAYLRSLFVSYGVYDEGLILYGAQRVLDGKVPYADFWSLYAPGQFYTLAALFSAFGSSIVVERAWSLASGVAVVLFSGAFVRSQARALPSIYAMCACSVWLAALPMFGSPQPTSVAFALLSLVSFERALQSASGAPMFAAALAAGATLWFRHDIGALLILAEISTAITAATRRAPRARANLGVYAAGIAAAVLPGAVLLLAAVPLETLLDRLVVFPATGFAAQRALAWPALDSTGALFYAVPIALSACGMRAALLVRTGCGPTPGWWCGWAFGVLLLQPTVVRSDLPHMLPSGVMAIALTAAITPLKAVETRLSALTRRAAITAGVLAWIAALPAATRSLVAGERTLVPSSLERAAGIAVPPAKQRYERVVQFVRQQVPEGRALFVGNTRHDLLSMNDAIFYFLVERDSVSAYHELHPGVATRRDVQELIVRDLANADVVVLANFASEEDNESSRSSGVTLLDDAIRRDFAPIFQEAGYQVLRRR